MLGAAPVGETTRGAPTREEKHASWTRVMLARATMQLWLFETVAQTALEKEERAAEALEREGGANARSTDQWMQLSRFALVGGSDAQRTCILAGQH